MNTDNSLRARMFGVLRAPRATFERLAASPRWLDVLIVTFALSALSSAVLLETETGRLALLDRWERLALAFGQPVDDAQYAALTRASEHGALYGLVSALVSGPLAVLALSAALFGLFRLVGREGPGFRRVLAMVAHASIILTLRHVVAAPFAYARETLASPLTLNLFFTALDENSPWARFCGIVDLFVVWWIVVLATAMSVLVRTPTRRLALAFLGIYVLLAGMLTLAMALTGGMA